MVATARGALEDNVKNEFGYFKGGEIDTRRGGVNVPSLNSNSEFGIKSVLLSSM